MISLLLCFLSFFIPQTCPLTCLLITLLLTALMPSTLLYHLTCLLSLSCGPAAYTALSISTTICMYIPADLTFLCSFSSLLIYFSGFVCILAGSDSTHYQCCINMNMQCKLVSSPLYEQLNHILAVSDVIACSTGNLTTLAGLRCSFVGAVCHHRHCLRCSAAAPAAAAPATNPFSPPAEFSHLILALKDIFNVLCYQVCWSFLIKTRQN